MPESSHLKAFATEVVRLANAGSTTESTYYPAIKALVTAVLTEQELPFEVRTGTSQRRSGGGSDQPDLALYDASGTVLVLCGEVKLPSEDLSTMAVSTDRNDQVGRYLAKTRAVLLCNVRGFGLVTADPAYSGAGAVPPSSRRLECEVEMWPSTYTLRQGKPIPAMAAHDLAILIEVAATRYASIAEPESLARILAQQARRAKADLPDKFSDAVQGLLDDFGRALGITFEGPEGEEFFRSSLIQTAFYGLFAGWALWWYGPHKEPFRWEHLSDYLKIPFLGGLFHEFRHPTRIKELRLAKHLDIATETLSRAVPEVFFSRFQPPALRSSQQRGSGVGATAILYFYEPFLRAFDPDLRKTLGVWYTPVEIIQYQVARIDHLLRTELSCERGFADEKVVVLDPCCGTGAYLLEVARYVVRQLEEEGVGPLLGAKLLDALCRRIIGFEILTAPFVVAHLQLYLVLSELGAAPSETQRPAIFLTNALTGWSGRDQLKLNFPELQEEHDAVQGIKNEAKIIVVLGNPPYNRFAGVPMTEEADLVDTYKGIRRGPEGEQQGRSDLFTRWGIRKHLLNDLYIRFFRLAETRIGVRAEYGIVSFISNSSYLTGRSHPIMRESLLTSFHAIWIDNLHGNRLASERTPWGDSCETIFNTDEGGPGIKVGTAVSTFLKRRERPSAPDRTRVYTRDFWGRAESKRRALLESLEMTRWPRARRADTANRPEGPRDYEQFTPTEKNQWKLVPRATSGGFEDWPGLDGLFPVAYQGVNPNRGLDGSVVDTDRAAIEQRMREYYSSMSWREFQIRHPELCEPRARYDPKAMRTSLQKLSQFRPENIVPYVVFPLDGRWIYYETAGKLLNERRPELWRTLQGNEFLIAVPQPRRTSEARPLLTTSLFDLHLHDRGSVGFPAEIRPNSSQADLFAAHRQAARGPEANLAEAVWQTLRGRWDLRGDRRSATARKLARTLFSVCLAICHAPQYESDHLESLAQDWAHVPIPRDWKLVESVAELGAKVATLLNPFADARSTVRAILGKDAQSLGTVARVGGGTVRASDFTVTFSYYGAAQGSWRPREVSGREAWRPRWGATTGDLYLNDTVFLQHVPERVWRYELGGYPVVKKWLGYRNADRRDKKPLTLVEVEHLGEMVQRLAAMLVLHEQLDLAYEGASADALSRDDLNLQ